MTARWLTPPTPGDNGMTDHKALIAEARDAAEWCKDHTFPNAASLFSRLADALERAEGKAPATIEMPIRECGKCGSKAVVFNCWKRDCPMNVGDSFTFT